MTFSSVYGNCSRVISILLFHFQTLLCRRLSNGHLSSKYRLFLLNNSPMEEFQSGCCTAVSDQCCSDLHHAMTRTEIEICKLCFGNACGAIFYTPIMLPVKLSSLWVSQIPQFPVLQHGWCFFQQEISS